VPDYSVTFARSARKELERLSSSTAQRVIQHVERLGISPRPQGAAKLQGQKNLWRIRIGDYRMIYSIDDSTHVIDISAVRHRQDVYRNL